MASRMSFLGIFSRLTFSSAVQYSSPSRSPRLSPLTPAPRRVTPGKPDSPAIQYNPHWRYVIDILSYALVINYYLIFSLISNHFLARSVMLFSTAFCLYLLTFQIFLFILLSSLFFSGFLTASISRSRISFLPRGCSLIMKASQPATRVHICARTIQTYWELLRLTQAPAE